MRFRDHYPNYTEIQADGEVLYEVPQVLGGRDEDGEYMLVLEGPAQGEKVYL